MDAKSSVYFYVKRETNSNRFGTLNFDRELVNIGDSINLKTGKFIAPRNGIYYFTFLGLMKLERSLVKDVMFNHRISLHGVQSKVDAWFYEDNASSMSSSLHATSYLKKGDEVYLNFTWVKKIDDNKFRGGLEWFQPLHYTHFSGGLLQEL